jgi:hypothetical protein
MGGQGTEGDARGIGTGGDLGGGSRATTGIAPSSSRQGTHGMGMRYPLLLGTVRVLGDVS